MLKIKRSYSSKLYMCTWPGECHCSLLAMLNSFKFPTLFRFRCVLHWYNSVIYISFSFIQMQGQHPFYKKSFWSFVSITLVSISQPYNFALWFIESLVNFCCTYVCWWINERVYICLYRFYVTFRLLAVLVCWVNPCIMVK